MSESIYNLVPREYVVPDKPKMYQSVHHGAGPESVAGSTFGCRGTTRLPGAGVMVKKDGALFGAHKTLPNTSQSLKAQSKPERKSKESFKYTDARKPAVPKKDETPVMGIASNKNYVTANAVEAILMVPKSTQDKELNYLEKEDYGKIPEYLTHVKEEVRRENEMIDQYVREQMGTTEKQAITYEELDEAERDELVYALKTKWDSVNAQYQKIAHLVRLDTIGQQRRKESMELQLKQLEADIEKLTRLGPVLVS